MARRPTGRAGGFVVVAPGKAIAPVRPVVGPAAPNPWPVVTTIVNALLSPITGNVMTSPVDGRLLERIA